MAHAAIWLLLLVAGLFTVEGRAGAQVPEWSGATPAVSGSSSAGGLHVAANPETDVYNLTLQNGRAGVCSPMAVTAFSYTFSASLPGVNNVLAASKSAYDALYNADLSSPTAGNLPSPLVAMSLIGRAIISGSRSMPAGKKLISQVMCLLVDNRAGETAPDYTTNPPPPPPPSLPGPTTATLNVTWTYAT